MLFTGHIVAWYSARSGRYLGKDWKYMDAVAVAESPRQGTQKYDRITFRAKNEILDELNRQGCLEGGSVCTFDLEMDSEEYIPGKYDRDRDDRDRATRDKTPSPRNKMPILRGIGQPFDPQQQS